MGEQVTIRPAVPSDVIEIGEVARRTWQVTYEGVILPENQERLLGRYYAPGALEQAIGQERSWFFVAVAGERVVGFAQFIGREDGSGELTRIYVVPEWQRHGIGRRFLAEGLAALEEYRTRRLVVHVEKGNPIGIRFYENNQFHLEREFSVDLADQELVLLEYVLTFRYREHRIGG